MPISSVTIHATSNCDGGSMSFILNRRGFLIAGGLTALASTKVFGANERLRVGVKVAR